MVFLLLVAGICAHLLAFGGSIMLMSGWLTLSVLTLWQEYCCCNGGKRSEHNENRRDEETTSPGVVCNLGYCCWWGWGWRACSATHCRWHRSAGPCDFHRHIPQQQCSQSDHPPAECNLISTHAVIHHHHHFCGCTLPIVAEAFQAQESTELQNGMHIRCEMQCTTTDNAGM